MTPKQTLFQNEEYQDLFQQLFSLAKDAEGALPFIPLIPDDWGEGTSKKIIWYGAATDGWGYAPDMRTFDFFKENARNEASINKTFHDGNLQSRFWRVQKKCLNQINETWDSVIWNNVFKIGGQKNIARGMPVGDLRRSQRKLCVKIFKLELKVLCPELVVLHVGEHLKDVRQNLYGPWNDNTVQFSRGTGTAAYTNYDNTNFIWLSRRPKTDQEYCSSFSNCLNGLGLDF